MIWGFMNEFVCENQSECGSIISVLSKVNLVTFDVERDVEESLVSRIVI